MLPIKYGSQKEEIVKKTCRAHFLSEKRKQWTWHVNLNSLSEQ